VKSRLQIRLRTSAVVKEMFLKALPGVLLNTF
jgi:hypothetical protein